MQNFTLNHSTKQIFITDGYLFADIVHHFSLMNIDMTHWTIMTKTQFSQIKHLLIQSGKNSDPYFNPPPTIFM